MKKILTLLILFPAIISCVMFFSGTVRAKTAQEETNERLTRIEERIEALIEIMEVKFEAVDKRFEAIDKRFEVMENNINERFEAVDNRFESMERSINDRFLDFRWLFGITLSAVVGLFGFVLYDRRNLFFRFQGEVKKEVAREVAEAIINNKRLSRA